MKTTVKLAKPSIRKKRRVQQVIRDYMASLGRRKSPRKTAANRRNAKKRWKGDWWRNSASCVIWAGVGKERKIAVASSSENAARILECVRAMIGIKNPVAFFRKISGGGTPPMTFA